MAAPTYADPVIHTTQGYVSSAGVKMLVYAPPHKGKTDLIKTLPKPLVLASEHGLATLNKYNIPYTQCATVDQVKALTKWINDGKYKGKYETLVLDSVSYLTTILLSEFRNNSALYTNNGQKHYGLLKENVTDLLAALFAANVHVYVTAWEGDKYDAFGTLVCNYPETEGKALQSYLVHYFDLTAHLAWHSMDVAQADGTTLKQEFPYLQTVEANGKFARSRVQGLDAFEPAHLGNLINKLANLQATPQN